MGALLVRGVVRDDEEQMLCHVMSCHALCLCIYICVCVCVCVCVFVLGEGGRERDRG